MDLPRVYNKADSLHGVGQIEPDQAIPLARIGALYDSLDQSGLDNYRREIVDRACRALLGRAREGEPEYRLRPHIIAELEHIRDAELLRYLFYRYRYDVFPLTHELDAYPPCVQIEPTSICNYRCVFCYQTDRTFTQGRGGHMGQMSLDMFKRVVDEIEGEVDAVTLASRGEPLMCKQIVEMLDYLRGKFLALKINTNAWFLDERKAHAILETEPNTLVFSADAADPELYAQLRVNGKLERVLENIRRFVDIKAKQYPSNRTITRVSGVQFSDKQDFSGIQQFWRDYVDQVAFVDYNPWENAYESPPNKMTTPCSDLWRRTFVWWDGRMNPCDVDYKSALTSPAESVQNKTVSQLWRGDEYENLRRLHLSGERQSLSPCKGCVVV